ncbi:hypothetical protein BDP27DRAFT_1239864 [Rhodocollybia butyracea]|uniref:Cytochrome P450 n=1 Tax=Rhodocollybia butyracea TaxID=206335 RepID=A0A9P5P8P7_9AGAR|nr:hypothetical protein BDP27DRAFT_1239864 [Rhodocollybia butyracea]
MNPLFKLPHARSTSRLISFACDGCNCELQIPEYHIYTTTKNQTQATHLWFKTHEPASFAPIYLAVLGIPALPTFILSHHVASPVYAVLIAYPSFYALVLLSITLYRLSPFHPLARYPGPTIAKVSKLWTVWMSLDGKLPQYYKKLHEQYGSIVRVGEPNEISVGDKDLLPFIIGAQGMPKGPLWEGRITPKKNPGSFNLINTRDLSHHAQLRKTWNRAFADEPLSDYREIWIRNVEVFMGELEKQCAAGGGYGVLDVARSINLFL